MSKGMKAFVDRLEARNEHLEAENKRLTEAISKMVRDRIEDSCAYCQQKKPELMLCCHECYMEI